MRTRNNRIVFYLNDEELDTLTNKLSRTHLSREAFIRKALDNATIREAPPADVPYLLREIRRVGYNINQILALANAKGFYNTADLRAAILELRETEKLIFNTYTKP